MKAMEVEDNTMIWWICLNGHTEQMPANVKARCSKCNYTRRMEVATLDKSGLPIERQK